MDEYNIQIILKIGHTANSLFYSSEKIVELLKLNDKLQIYKEDIQCKIKFEDTQYNFSVTTESSYIYSITITHIERSLDHFFLTYVFDNLTKTAREIKITILGNIKDCSCEVLWDDVGMYYATIAFPFIIKIENLMRKLITKFMLVSVGMDFFHDIPEGITVRNKNEEESGFLHNVDFIDLAKYLFDARPLKKIENLIKIINDLEENSLPDDVNLLDYKKDSYWNRYFRDIVGNHIEASYIKKQWEDLYKLRCKIAHSRFLRKNECENVIDICKRLSSIFTSALDNLNDVHLSEESKETISEEIFSEIEDGTWHEKLYDIIIRNFKSDFTLTDVYAFEPVFKEQYPENHTIKASIRRNLQKLRDCDKIEFLDPGNYKIINKNIDDTSLFE